MKNLTCYFAGVSALLCLFSCEKPADNGTGGKETEPQAAFEFSIVEGTGTVNFTNKSQNAISYEWEFGDGQGFSTEKDPSYTYEKSGNYEVILTAINGKSISTVSKEISVNITVQKPELSIEIDGQIDDWNNIPWRDDVKGGGELQRIKTAATKDYVYVLIQGTKEMKTKSQIPRFTIDVDNDKTTGCQDAWWIKEGEDGMDLLQQEAGFHIYGWRAEEGIVGWDWIQDGWPEWTTVVIDENTYMEWKINVKFAVAHMLENSIFEIPDQDYEKFATKASTEKYRMAIGFFEPIGQVWEYSASAPEKGGVPFDVIVNEYVEAVK